MAWKDVNELYVLTSYKDAPFCDNDLSNSVRLFCGMSLIVRHIRMNFR